MEAMDTKGYFLVDDDLLNFSLDEEQQQQQQQQQQKEKISTITMKEHSFSSSFSLESSDPISHLDDDSFPEFAEEELEWLSNKDAFPGVETCLDILSDNPSIELDHHSPVSVLENSSSSSNNSKSHGNGSGGGSTITSCCDALHVPISYPVGKRSKRRRSRRRAGFADLPSQQTSWLNQVNVKNKLQEPALPISPIASSNTSTNTSIGRRCLHCLAEKTPQWRAGPMGPKTLCNACGVRFKSGRLVPEYRPASSPTFSAAMHSNSHRKIIEMIRQKQTTVGGMDQACG